MSNVTRLKPDPDLHFPQAVKAAIEEQQRKLWSLLAMIRAMDAVIDGEGSSHQDIDLPALIEGAVGYGEAIHSALDCEDLHRRATELAAEAREKKTTEKDS